MIAQIAYVVLVQDAYRVAKGVLLRFLAHEEGRLLAVVRDLRLPIDTALMVSLLLELHNILELGRRARLLRAAPIIYVLRLAAVDGRSGHLLFILFRQTEDGILQVKCARFRHFERHLGELILAHLV